MSQPPRLLLAAALALLAGCSSGPSRFPAQEAAKYGVQSTDNFVVVEASAQNSLSCTGLIERRVAGGRLQITANVKSRVGAALSLQARCVFRDAQGLVCEETPWQAFALSGGDTQTLTFASADSAAKDYSVRVRLASP